MNNHHYEMSFKIYAIIFQVDTELPRPELCQPLELPLVTPSHPRPHSAPATFPNVISENWTLTALTKLQQQPTSITLYRSTVLYQYSHRSWHDLTLSYIYFKFTVCSSCLECIFQEVMDSLKKTDKPPPAVEGFSPKCFREVLSLIVIQRRTYLTFQVPPRIQSLRRMKFYRQKKSSGIIYCRGSS